MGCSSSIVIHPSPIEQAILREDLDLLKSLLENPDISSQVNTPVNYRDLEYSPGHASSQYSSPLVIAARSSSVKVVYFLLKAYPNIENEIKREALMHALQRKHPLDFDTIRVLLAHGADIRSPLRLCQALKNYGLSNQHRVHKLFQCLLENSVEKNTPVVHGAILNSLYNQAVRIRARIGEDLGRGYLEWLFHHDVTPASYWDTYFLDTCICDDDNRLFRPTSAAVIFIKATTVARNLRQVLTSAQLFRLQSTSVVHLLDLAWQAGAFTTQQTRITSYERRTLLRLNDENQELPVLLDWIEDSYRNPDSLRILCARTVRALLAIKHNPYSGVTLLAKDIYLPQYICDILLLER